MNPLIQWAQKHGLWPTAPVAAAPAPARRAPPLPPGFAQAIIAGRDPLSESPAASPATVAQPMAKEHPMTDIIQDGVQLAETAVEKAAGTVITQITNGAVKLWSEAESIIDGDVAKVKAALPASAIPGFDLIVSDIKQGASDTLTLASGGLSTAAPAITSGLEKLADAGLASVSNGVALPLVPLVNSGIDDLVNLMISTAQAWGLKAKASLATTSA